MSKPNTPILPVHAQDITLPLSSPTPTPGGRSPAPTTPQGSQDGLISPPRTARTHSNVHWSVPNTPYTPKTMHTTRTGRTAGTGGTGRSTAIDALENVVEKLEEQTVANVWDAEDPEPERKYQESLRSGKTGHTAHSGKTGKTGHSGKTGSHAPSTFVGKVNHFRHHLRHWLHNDKFHYTIIGLVILDLIAVFLDLTLSLLTLSCFTDDQLEYFASFNIPNPPESASCVLHESTALTGADWFLWALSVFLLCIFTLEIFASLFAFGPRHFTKPLYAIDALVVLASLIMEVYFKFADNGKSGSSPAALIVLRLWKIIRAIHAIAHSIELKNQAIISAVRGAMEEVQEEQARLADALEREQIRGAWMRRVCGEVREEEMERFVEEEVARRKAAELEEEEEEEGSGDSSDEGEKEKPKEEV